MFAGGEISHVRFPPWIVAVLTTLQTYGMLLADNGGAGTPLAIIGDGSSALSSAIANDAYMLKTITTSDLEVADTGAVTQD